MANKEKKDNYSDQINEKIEELSDMGIVIEPQIPNIDLQLKVEIILETLMKNKLLSKGLLKDLLGKKWLVVLNELEKDTEQTFKKQFGDNWKEVLRKKTKEYRKQQAKKNSRLVVPNQ